MRTSYWPGARCRWIGYLIGLVLTVALLH